MPPQFNYEVPEFSEERDAAYLAVRKKEQRIFSDETVKTLPYLNDRTKLGQEWKLRASSFIKLKKHLEKKNASLRFLDLGCGNGWMSNALSMINNSHVIAIDTNAVELQQGARVFEENKRLTFCQGDIFKMDLPPGSFDVIVCAASVQYFPSLTVLIKHLVKLLKPGGEIHVIDSPVYEEAAVVKARRATLMYYEKLGNPEMAGFYHHHTWSELDSFLFRVKNNFAGIRIPGFSAPFPWIIISQ